MHISARIEKAVAANRPFYSLEYFPPKTSQGLANLYVRIARMNLDLRPEWVQITWGAGGTTQRTSLELAARVENGILDPDADFVAAFQRKQSDERLATNACLHLTCTNVERASLDETLDRALELGITNVLALRGDPPRGQEYWVAADDRFQHATDLVRYIRERHGDKFCIGVAGYPEMHPDAASSSSSSSSAEIDYLLEKQRAGANFIVTQLFYDVDAFVHWYAACRARGITLPILPGIMPIQNYQSFRRMTTLCKTKVPQAVWDALEPIRHDDAAVKEFGVRQATNIIRRLCDETDIRGFHICTLNLEKSVRGLLESLGWVSPKTAVQKGPGGLLPDQQPWDEFPNGRYGDSRSPAYGELDGYGVSLKVAPQEALRLWGFPLAEADVSTIFCDYLCGRRTSIPWCDCPIMDETASIRSELLSLNSAQRTWWTVGSQPAVDGVDSSDPTYGFGPKAGHVFQKAFVEFFATGQHLAALQQRIAASAGREEGWITFLAGNRRGDFVTNMREGDVNAVTWAVFPGQEIVQSTIIEEESFKAWRDEAFAIWAEWELLFAKGSPTRELLRRIGDERWLVTVVHHDFKREKALWTFLDSVVASSS
ncbi:MTHFR-domain-containing protein [Acaromyces ingoldii]|uniref:MTHFR-domain-containing protein n=1 Tax=Acaromyces ingoldii TaxID=215250 RepID=A0A316YXZ0_9BASI|nr:MTHFR-domain-containing protein [Acaromyces ingoldii]PWN92685.1 MTHFR-domain-containing protein [Acaromyces ingoldii]